MSSLAVVAVAAVVSYFIQLPYYALTPGKAPAVSGYITVPPAQRHPHKGSVLLVYVELTQMRALYYPFFWLDSNAAIYPSGEILGTETTAQYATEGEIDMSTAQQAASVVALQQLGYKVPLRELGALVYGIDPGTPAAAALQVGDVISRIDGVKVPTWLGLTAKLQTLDPYATVHLTVFAYPAGKPRTLSVKMGIIRTTPAAPGGYTCFPEGKGTRYAVYTYQASQGAKPRALACLGIYSQGSGGPSVDGTAFKVGPLPVKVNLASEGIVGPSAGLAFTLGLLQELDPADLTGGLKVAASGTMSIDGTVGDVGGIAQKTIAVRGAGAQVFLVPPLEYAVAKSHAGSHLKVYAVSTITQAVRILESLGGRIKRIST
jgi:PDZ domain-containing protein